ncbi:cytochrome P450, cyclodipeptide synthase-associated [Streptomyces sp. NBC_01433]|uniref:cytochrome P450, cyclodipeptide synthase-associated n=1 Tax=Streptomyces sp. NBC_01433 TaxID=2903864 RepID=UPI0022530758|nr:cytochrome P450, cyclodipeptide synthase-associated [Streptomyces sp. NBC_01433]MCX4679435.1 cytochrome P450, cyclodipeptide synthase-associated [Streptomyces sp. NBC_01433]
MHSTARIISVLSDEFARDPYAWYPQLRESDPVHYEPGIGAYFLSRHEDVRRVLTQDQIFTTQALRERAEPVMRGRVLAQMTGAEHTAKHRTMIHGYTGTMLEDQTPLIRRNVEELIRPHLRRGRFDLVKDFGQQLAIWVALDSLGLPKDDWRNVHSWFQGVAEFVTSVTLTEERYQHCVQCARRLEDYLRPFIEERRENPGQDVISLMCHTEYESGRMSLHEVTALCHNVLLAATEPADKTLALLFRHLITHPDQMALVRGDPKLVTNAIAETLRYTPPVQLIPRKTAESVEISGVAIPAETMVWCMLAAANRDPRVFERPDTFDLHRTDLGPERSFTAAANHFGFGAGMHSCVGAAFARRELETVVTMLLALMENIGFPEDATYEETGFYSRGPESLTLTFEPTAEGRLLAA